MIKPPKRGMHTRLKVRLYILLIAFILAKLGRFAYLRQYVEIVFKVSWVCYFIFCKMVDDMCCKSGTPVIVIASCSSWFNVSSNKATPSDPPPMLAIAAGRPIKTASAPRANAFRTSSLCRMPPSMKIVNLFFYNGGNFGKYR